MYFKYTIRNAAIRAVGYEYKKCLSRWDAA